jgi:hypothetical protein
LSIARESAESLTRTPATRYRNSHRGGRVTAGTATGGDVMVDDDGLGFSL